MIAVPVAGAALVGLLLRVLDLPLPPRTPLLHLLQPLARATAAPYFARRQQAVDGRSGGREEGREKACRYSVGTSSHRTAQSVNSYTSDRPPLSGAVPHHNRNLPNGGHRLSCLSSLSRSLARVLAVAEQGAQQTE